MSQHTYIIPHTVIVLKISCDLQEIIIGYMQHYGYDHNFTLFFFQPNLFKRMGGSSGHFKNMNNKLNTISWETQFPHLGCKRGTEGRGYP